MNSFLHRVARQFFSTYESEIRKFTFVFPNRRAGLFFQKYLAELIDKPIFSPEVITVNDCFFHSSKRRPADRTSELFRLFRIYKQLSKSEESFDTFVFWGEMLLADFDDVDKYMIDARQLFTNVKELKELDMIFDAFNEEQKKAIRQFWEHFLPAGKSTTQESFITTWRILFPLYNQFREELLSDNLATEGMIMRETAEQLAANQPLEYFAGRQFVFVGFNALNPSERILFTELQKRGQADFYWDYEAREVRDADNQASLFFKENTRLFPSKYSIQTEALPLKSKMFELIAIPSAVGQAKEVYRLLEKLYPHESDETEWIRTAVVLPDENLLLPLLHSLPENIGQINVTMGFPLKSTPAAGLLEHIFELHKKVNAHGSFYHQTVSDILNHQYISMLCRDEARGVIQKMIETNAVYVDRDFFGENKLMKAVFIPCNTSREFMDCMLNVLKMLIVDWQNLSEGTGKYRLECDFLHQYYMAVNRMNDVMMSQDNAFEISLDTLIRLTRQLTAGITIPFEGEPLQGLQIMGMLETRGLDFENVIICSFNEGVFPKKNMSGSFIPYNLRNAFGMPISDFHDSIAAYNFYRLIHRAKRLFFLYDSRTEGLQTGEASRYINQLRYHYGIDFGQVNITYDMTFPAEKTIEVKKTPEIMEKLRAYSVEEKNAPALSATSLNTYIDCPLQFYFTQIEQMREPDEVQETIEASMFGTLLHEVMENIYKPFENKQVSKLNLEELSNNKLLIDKTITRAFAAELFNKKGDSDDDVKLEGNNLLMAKVIKKYVMQILRRDAEHAPFRYVCSELYIRTRLPIYGGAEKINLKGFIDRVDEKQGMVRILDYKSGSGSLEFKTIDEMFNPDAEKRSKFVLQTFLYSLIYQQQTGARQVIPGILYIRDIFKDNFSTTLIDRSVARQNKPVEDFGNYRDEFITKLTICLEEIFNPDIPFVQCSKPKPCEWCAYKTICRR